MNKIYRSTQNFNWKPGFRHLSTSSGTGKKKINPFPRPRQVLLIGNGNAFAEGIMNFLNHQLNLQAWFEEYQDDISILRKVARYQPDVVALVTSHAMNLETILGLLMSIHASTHLRLILLSLESNKVEIYETESTVKTVKSININLRDVDDFLTIIDKGWNVISGYHGP